MGPWLWVQAEGPCEDSTIRGFGRVSGRAKPMSRSLHCSRLGVAAEVVAAAGDRIRIRSRGSGEWGCARGRAVEQGKERGKFPARGYAQVTTKLVIVRAVLTNRLGEVPFGHV